MQVVLNENVVDNLTNQITERWKHDGIHTRLTWMEIKRLTEHFLKACREKQVDHKEYDLYTILDSNLNYYENRATIDDQLGFNEVNEKAASDKLKDYLTEEELKSYTSQERNTIDQLETDTEATRKKLNIVLKAQENHKQEAETIKQEIDRIKNKLDSQQYDDIRRVEEEYKKLEKVYDNVIVKLTGVLDLEKKVDAMLKSQSFQDVGKALKPFVDSQPKVIPDPIEPVPLKPKKKKLQHFHPIDGFITAALTIIWLATTYGVLASFSFSCWVIVGLSGLWITYAVLVSLIVGDTLNVR